MTPTRWRPAAALVLLVALTGCASTMDRMVDRAADAAGRAVDRQVDRRTDRAVNTAIDGMFDAGDRVVRCVFTDETCIRDAQDRGGNVVLTDADGNPVDRSGNPVDEAHAEDAVIRTPGSGGMTGSANANYDFVPGERVLYAEDFSAEYVGNVPRSLTFLGGTAEVVDWNGDKMLRTDGNARFAIPLPGGVPERFTIEFDLYRPDAGSNCGNGVFLTFEEPDTDQYLTYSGVGTALAFSDCKAGVVHFEDGPESAASVTGRRAAYAEGVAPIRIAVDGSYVKAYIGERRVANIPNADIQRGDALYLVAAGYNGSHDYVDNIRIGAGGREILYDQLMADGRATLGGLQFDTGSARLRSESTAVLQELKGALDQSPSLRLRVEGHTDTTGSADGNQRLSQQRAEAVVAWLTQNGVATSRLEAAGYGQTQPVADNGTEAGRQQNRRVDVVRL